MQKQSVEGELRVSMGGDFPDLAIGLRNVVHKVVGGLRITLAEASITEMARVAQMASRPPASSTQTVAYYEARGATFPRFRLRPSGLMLKMAGAMGTQGLRFQDQPEFTSQYFVLATEPLGSQALLSADVRAWLLAHPGLYVESGGCGVLVYRGGKVLAPGELEAFAREAADLLLLLEQGRRRLEKSPAKPSSEDELRAFAAQMPPSVARSIEKQLRARLVTREDVDAFVRQHPPRKIPTNIASQYRAPAVIAAVGTAFVAVGGGLGLVFAAQRHWGGAIFASLFFLAGSAMLFFGARSWWRQRRLLCRGELAAARIESVEPAGMSDEDGAHFNISARYQAGGQSRQGRGKVKGGAGGLAKSLAAEGKTAEILYDPEDPERIVLVDALVREYPHGS